jgi:exosortase
MVWILAALIAVLYAVPLKGLASEWMSSPDASYGVLLASVAVGLAWQRRRQFRAAANPDFPPLPGFALLTLGLGAYLAGFLGADLFLTRSSLVVVLGGLAWLLAGRAAFRVMLAPLVFLLLAIPLPTLVVNAVTLPLQMVASQIAESALGTIGVPVFRDGNVLQVPSANLQVAEACSGLRSLVSLGACGVLLAWATQSSRLKQVAIIAATVPLAIVMNGFRIAATGVACEIWGRHVASGGWHTMTGWVTFVVSMSLLVQASRMLTRVRWSRRAWTPEEVEAS